MPALSLRLLFDQLNTLGSRDASVHEVKTTIQLLNAFLLKSGSHPDPQPLKDKKIFPICEPATIPTHSILVSLEVDFAIVDNQPLAKLFEGKARILAFTLQEVAQLRPFINWMGLGSCYLTRCVNQVTSFWGRTSQQDLLPRLGCLQEGACSPTVTHPLFIYGSIFC